MDAGDLAALQCEDVVDPPAEWFIADELETCTPHAHDHVIAGVDELQGVNGSDVLERTEQRTWCPYKGDCNYFSIPIGGERSRNAAWTYEAPHAAVARIREHVAFYPGRVDSIEELDA